MAAYDPQRSRPRHRVADDAGPAPVDELLDATPEPIVSSPVTTGARTTASERVAPEATDDDGSPTERADRPTATEVIDLAPAPPAPSADRPRRARLAFVLVVVALALVGFVLRRVGASRRARRP